MTARQITGSVLQSGRIFKAGDEDALAAILPANDVTRLHAKGVLTGDWGTTAPAVEPTVTRIDGKPLELNADGMIEGEPLNLTDEERANLPPLEPAKPDAPMVTGTANTPAAKPKKTRAAKSAAKSTAKKRN